MLLEVSTSLIIFKAVFLNTRSPLSPSLLHLRSMNSSGSPSFSTWCLFQTSTLKNIRMLLLFFHLTPLVKLQSSQVHLMVCLFDSGRTHYIRSFIFVNSFWSFSRSLIDGRQSKSLRFFTLLLLRLLQLMPYILIYSSLEHLYQANGNGFNNQL